MTESILKGPRPMTRRLYALVAAIALALAFALGAPGIASADQPDTATSPTSTAMSTENGEIGINGWPTGCSYGQFQNGAAAECTNSNGGRYRAVVTCLAWSDGSYVTRVASSWNRSGTSYVWCPPMTQYVYAGIMTRSY